MGTLAWKKRTNTLVFIVLQLSFAFLGIVSLKRFPRLSKLFTLLAIPIAFAGVFSKLTYVFDGYTKQEFFLFGSNIGIISLGLAINIRYLLYKLLLTLALFITRIITLRGDYVEAPTNLITDAIVTALVIASFTYQEVLTRSDYKNVTESQEELSKFKNLLSHDFPIGVLVVSRDVSSVLYSNQFFRTYFEEEDHTKILNTIFQKFEVEADHKKLNLPEDHPPITLLDFFKNYAAAQIKASQDNLLVIPTLYKGKNDVVHHYEIKIRKISWDLQSAYTVVFNDVSEKQLVTALKLADQQKDRIIATVSHELRTPINGTLGLLELVSSRITDEVSLKYIQYCKSCSNLLLYLVNSFLDLSQLKQNILKISKSYFNLNQLLEELQSLYLYQCQIKGIEIKVEKDDATPPFIYTDKSRLIEILINLVGNAVKFTFQGSVTIRVELDKEDSNKLKFSVKDTGIGVKDEDKGKLFKRFGKLGQKNENINQQGVGLGLAIVQDLVMAVDNNFQERVHFESTFGKGSLFSFKLLYQKERRESIDYHQKLGKYLTVQSPRNSISGMLRNITFTGGQTSNDNTRLISPKSHENSRLLSPKTPFSPLLESQSPSPRLKMSRKKTTPQIASLDSVSLLIENEVAQNESVTQKLKRYETPILSCSSRALNLSEGVPMLRGLMTRHLTTIAQPICDTSPIMIGGDEFVESEEFQPEQPDPEQPDQIELPELQMKPSTSIKLKNVLIVDDNPFNILAASFIVEKLKCAIDKAFHGEECIALIKKNLEQNRFYDFILMDIQMPIMDGPQASKVITDMIKSNELKELPIIALTAKKSTAEEKKYYKECGICAVLEKPLNESKLIEVIKLHVKTYELEEV